MIRLYTNTKVYSEIDSGSTTDDLLDDLPVPLEDNSSHGYQTEVQCNGLIFKEVDGGMVGKRIKIKHTNQLSLTPAQIFAKLLDKQHSSGCCAKSSYGQGPKICGNHIYFPYSRTSIFFNRTLNGKVTKYELTSESDSTTIHMTTHKRGLAEETIWMNFDTKKPVALKIGIDNFDMVTGEELEEGALTTNPQNYLALPKQTHIYGVMKDFDNDANVDDNNNPYTLRKIYRIAKPTKPAEHMSIKFELFYRYETDFSIYVPRYELFDEGSHIGHTTLKDMGIKKGDSIVFFPTRHDLFKMFSKVTLRDLKIDDQDHIGIKRVKNVGTIKIHVYGVTNHTNHTKIKMGYSIDETVHSIKKRIHDSYGYLVNRQQLIYNKNVLEDGVIIKKLLKGRQNHTFILSVKSRDIDGPPYSFSQEVLYGQNVQRLYLDDTDDEFVDAVYDQNYESFELVVS
jgi:hypothetical protein